MDAAGHPVNISAWTVDVSRHGARLRGVKEWNIPGETVGIRYGTEKARYRIVWVGAPGTPVQEQVGLCCEEAGKYIWGIEAPKSAQERTPGLHPTSFVPESPGTLVATQAVRAGAHNRRRDARYHASGGVKVQEVGSTAVQWTTLYDLSMGGCYVETTAPLIQGAFVEVVVHIGEVQIAARGMVTVRHPAVGMGLQFREMSSLNRARLQQVMNSLAETSTEA